MQSSKAYSMKSLALALSASAFMLTGCLSNNREAPPVLGASNIAVNPYLWRATLDTIDFMPLASTDPTGGIIITEWYANPAVPGERFKINAYILDTRLRADGINISVFKQTNGPSGWVDAVADQDTQIQLENAILTRARELKLGDIS